MKTYAVINQKGGVGKTTTVANLGAAIAAAGYNVCLMDLDPQSHLTLHMGIEPGSTEKSVYDVLTEEASIASATTKISEHLDLVPAVIDLAAAEVELAATVGREQILHDRIAAAALPHDFMLMDCPPSLGLLTLNALAAADEVIIPLQPHFLALQGLGKLLETVQLVQKRINPRLKVGGVVLCMYESQARLTNEVVADLESFLESSRGANLPWSQTRLFETPIRRNVKLAECPSHGQSIFDYDSSSRGAEDYGFLADEFLAMAGKQVAEWQQPRTAKVAAKPEAAATIESQAPAGKPAQPEAAETTSPVPPAADQPPAQQPGASGA